MGWPNCLRSWAYVAAMAMASRQGPIDIDASLNRPMFSALKAT
jgi:hypothetical protein